MPQIGRINLPDVFFDALLESATVAFIQEILRWDNQYQDASAPQKIIDLVTTFHDKYFHDPAEYLPAYIRIQTGDYKSDDPSIEFGEDIVQIEQIINELAKQKIVQLFSPDTTLIELASEYFEKLEVNRLIE